MTLIYCVDDNETARGAYLTILADSGHSPLTAVDGVDCLEWFEAVRPDLVITDIDMPRMDGLELIASLKAKHDFHKILAVTGETTQRKSALAAGAAEVLLKPHQDHELIAAIERVIALHIQ